MEVARAVIGAAEDEGWDVGAVSDCLNSGGSHKARLMLYSRDRAAGRSDEIGGDPVWLADHADYSYVDALVRVR
jgi:hypothetical protein